MELKLSELKTGQTAIIKTIGSKEMMLKLMEMGCIPGEQITIDNTAPMGDPISVIVSGYHLSLRKDEAEQIVVTIKN